MSHRYAVCGLVLELPFACELLRSVPTRDPPDVVLRPGPVPPSLPAPSACSDPEQAGVPWQAEPGRFLVLGGRRSGRFLVEDGKRIRFDRAEAGEQACIEHLLLHLVLAAVMRQRGTLVLHANALGTSAGAVIVSGRSGAGKSTTLAALRDRGCPVLSDDVTVLALDAESRLQVLPGAPQLYLCEDAAQALGSDVRDLPRNPYRRGKRIVTVATGSAAPLAAIYLLEASGTAPLRCRRQEGADKLLALQECLYGPLLPSEHARVFPALARVLQQIPVFRIHRPLGVWTTDAVVSEILGSCGRLDGAGPHVQLAP